MIAEQLNFPKSPFGNLLDLFRATAKTEREKGTYFERLVKLYLTREPYYADLYVGVALA